MHLSDWFHVILKFISIVTRNYTGDGTVCIDSDECDSNPCGVGGDCKNLRGSYECQCLPGFESDGNGKCQDVDECVTSAADQCPTNSNCVNLVGTFECKCTSGYKPSNGRCVDIDECSLGVCSPNASCTNSDGGSF